ncbi:MAG: nuclear transport factor 2 family protein [Phycisphaerae bacterium]|nr:nuclear transport factor 2 family protein [Phycisphaerae bacterium]
MVDGKTENEKQIAATIIAMEKAALERWGKGDPSGFLEISASDVVYFDPFLDKRLNGIDELKSLYEGIRGEVNVERYELIDPKVQLCGDVAVLTFNYTGYTNGEASRWNCTEVYRKQNDCWKIIQTHWSFTKPSIK